MRFIRLSALSLPVVLLSSLAILFSGCGQKSALVRIYFTTDDAGYLTPCG